MVAAFHALRRTLPVDEVHYATKCNLDPGVLASLHRAGCRFEIASYPELVVLRKVGVRAADVLFSNPVKPPEHVRRAFAAGCRRFAVDSAAELGKVATRAPGSAVYVRLQSSGGPVGAVPSEGEFGVEPRDAFQLLLDAAVLGLRPYGVTFHVGSQMLEPRAWGTAIDQVGALLTALDRSGVRLYRPRVVVEPGRALVAEAGVLVTTVLGRARRRGRDWVHLDVGAFNGVMEALETGNRLTYPLSDSRRGIPTRCHVTGPSCDSRDTILFDTALSGDLTCGDRVYIGSAGAYTSPARPRPSL